MISVRAYGTPGGNWTAEVTSELHGREWVPIPEDDRVLIDAPRPDYAVLKAITAWKRKRSIVQCERCKYRWPARSVHPKKCPNCHNPTLYVRERKDGHQLARGGYRKP